MRPRLLRLAGAAAGAALVLVLGAQGAVRVWHMKGEVARLERELVTLRNETDALSASVNRLRSDPDTIERVAREALGMVKPGDRVLKLPPSGGGR